MDKNSNPDVERRKVIQTIGVLGFGNLGVSIKSDNGNEATILFEKLTKRAQEQFLEAIKNGSITKYSPNLASQLVKFDVVIWKGEEYALETSYEMEARWHMSPESITEEQVVDYNQLISYENLDGQSKTVIDEALNRGQVDVVGLKEFPRQIRYKFTYLKRAEEYYDLWTRHSDVPKYTIRPSNV